MSEFSLNGTNGFKFPIGGEGFLTLTEGEMAAKYKRAQMFRVQKILSEYINAMPNGEYRVSRSDDSTEKYYNKIYASYIGVLENDEVVLLNDTTEGILYPLELADDTKNRYVFLDMSRHHGTYKPNTMIDPHRGSLVQDIFGAVREYNAVHNIKIVSVYKFPEPKLSSVETEIKYFDDKMFVSRLKTFASQEIKRYAEAMPDGKYYYGFIRTSSTIRNTPISNNWDIIIRPIYLGYFMDGKSPDSLGSVRAIYSNNKKELISQRLTLLMGEEKATVMGLDSINLPNDYLCFTMLMEDFINTYNLHMGFRNTLIALYKINDAQEIAV